MFAKLSTAALTAVSHLKEQPVSVVTESEPVPNIGYPGDNYCTLYDDNNFGGGYITFGNIEPFTWNLHAYGWGDRASAWICGKNV